MVEFKDKENKVKVFGWSGWDEKTFHFFHLYTAYRNQRMTKLNACMGYFGFSYWNSYFICINPLFSIF